MDKNMHWDQASLSRAQLTLFPISLDERIAADDPIRMTDALSEQVDWSESEHVRIDTRATLPVSAPPVEIVERVRRSQPLKLMVVAAWAAIVSVHANTAAMMRVLVVFISEFSL